MNISLNPATFLLLYGIRCNEISLGNIRLIYLSTKIHTYTGFYSDVFMTIRSFRKFTRSCGECRTAPSGRRPSDQTIWLGLWVCL